jgi:hypothetical protein
MPTVSQLPAQLDAECVAGDPFTISVTSSGATITSPTLTIRDGLGATVAVSPTVSQAGAVTTVAFSAANTTALKSSGQTKAEYLFSLSALVDGQGPFQLIARSLTVWPVGTAGVSSTSSATLAVTVGGAAVSLAVALGIGAGALIAANNLSDLTNVATARTNLGLGTAATAAASAFAPFNTPGMHIYRTGGGYASTPLYGPRGTVVPGEAAIIFSPLMAPATTSIDRIGIEVTSAGTASVSVCRLGIWADSGGAPGTLVLDAGTVATDSTGLKEITISQALTLGTLYWLGVVPQGAAATRPTITGSFYNGPVMNVANPGYSQAGYATSGTFTGALSSSPVLQNSAAGAAPRIFVRFT